MKIFQADAFTNVKYGGNPAAICPVDAFPDDGLMQSIALEMNLSETAFVAPANGDSDFEIRWFTPLKEVRLCGHATLAAAHIIFTELDWKKSELVFQTRQAGRLHISKNQDGYQMNFPSDLAVPFAADYCNGLIDQDILKCFTGTDDLMLILKDEKSVRDCVPDIGRIKKTDHRLVIVTAPGDTTDFVSRTFGPSVGIEEDPVTGSAHTLMAPYWSKVLGKNRLTAVQLSSRRGDLGCEIKGDRVLIDGQAITTMKGELL